MMLCRSKDIMTLALAFVVAIMSVNAETVAVLLSSRNNIAQLPAGATFLMADVQIDAKSVNTTQANVSNPVYSRLTRYAVCTLTPKQADELLTAGIIELVCPIGKLTVHTDEVTNDSLSSQQYALRLIGAQKAWTLATGQGIRVGVLDTGIDWNHPDLAASLAVNTAEDHNGNGTFEPWSINQEYQGVFGDLDEVDNDNNGYVDDVIGYDFVDQTIRNIGDDQQRDPIPGDEQGHGTSVAGVVAAQANNHIGIAGLAYDAKIVTLRAFDATGNAEEDDIAAALIYAALNNLSVVNMSFGDGVDSPVLRDAISFAASMGCVLVASAGNSGRVSRQFPAGYDQVIAVGSVNNKDQRSVFSSTGSAVSLVAPGESIVTTAVGGRYRTVSGTSFSAPCVAAASAMLLEQRPDITPQQLTGILQETALDLGDRGWDSEYGAGRLQADAALLSLGENDVAITSPHNEQLIRIGGGAPVAVIGSAYATLFESYTVFVGKGVEPQTWSQVVSDSQAVLSGLLANIPESMLQTGDNVVRLVVKLKSGNTLESRRRVHASSGPLKIEAAELVYAWNTDIRVGVLTITTDQPTQLTLIKTPDGHATDTTRDDLRLTHTHCITFDAGITGPRGTITALLQSTANDTVRYTTQYDLGLQAMPVTGMNTFDNGQFAGYVLNDVRDILDDGKPAFVMSDLQDGSFGALTIVQRDGFDFVKKLTTPSVWIPRGIGDANSNGLLDVFAHVVGKAVLFEQDAVGGSPFAHITFADTVNGYNAASMSDVNGDGQPDLVMLADDMCIVYTWSNGWQELGRATNTTAPAPGNAENRIDEVSVAVGDFDGDGAIEVAFADTDGDVVIAEYNGAGFSTTFTYESDGVGGSGYLAAGDVNNDGKPELLFGVPDDPYIDSDREYGRQVWTYHLFTSKAPGTYTEMWSDHVYGVRYGIGYRNGVELANVDNKAGDEVLICAFQRLFVFRYDSVHGMQPMFYKPDVVTPRFLTYDFDNDGTKELGFGTTTEGIGFMTDFYFGQFKSANNVLATPAGLRATLLAHDKVSVQWMPVEGATSYRIFSSKDGSGLLKAVDTVQGTVFEMDSLLAGRRYDFRVSALSTDTSLKESERSNIVGVTTGPSGEIVKVSPPTVTTSSMLNGVQLTLTYSTAMADNAPDPAGFTLYARDGSFVVSARSVSVGTDSSVVVSFPPAEYVLPIILLSAASFADRIGVPTTSSRIIMQFVTMPAMEDLHLVALTVISRSEVHLRYSMAVTDDALAIAPYTIAPTGTVTSVSRIDSSTVALHLSSTPPLAATGKTYALTVRNVVSTEGVPITTGLGNTMGFVITDETLDQVFVFPHPASITADGSVTFANLTIEADIEIVDQRFRVVRTIRESDGNGGATWDLRDGNGVVVPPGMYFYRVKGKGSGSSEVESGLRKIMIRQ